MSHDQNDQVSDPPFYPSGYSPEVTEEDSGYAARLVALERTHSGPIPSPEDLEHYKHVLPDAPDRILRMAELNAQSVREFNITRLSGQMSIEENRHKEVATGQYFGAVAVVIMAIVAIMALWTNHPVVAGTICSTTIVGVAAVFVTGRKIQEDNNKNEGDDEV